MTDQPWVPPGAPPGPPVGGGAPYPGPGTPPGAGGPYPGPPPGPPGPAPGPAPGAAPGGAPPPPPAPPGPGPQPYAHLDVRPGIVPLRPLNLGDIYGGVFTAVRGNPGATIGLAAVTTFLFLLPTTALGAWLSGQSGLDLFSESAGASDTLPSGFGIGILGLYLPGLGQALSAILLAGFLAQVVGQAVLGRKITMAATWRATRGRVPALLGAVLLQVLAFAGVALVTFGIPVGLILYAETAGSGSTAVEVLLVVLGALAFVAAVVVLSTRWAFATPAIVLDRVGVLRGLGRSWTLTGHPFSGAFWRIFGIRLLTALIVGLASSIVTVPITFALLLVAAAVLAGDPSGSAFLVLQTIVSGIAGLITGALTTPFSAGVDALLYVDARVRREGLDVRLIQTSQGAAPPPWPVVTS